MSEALDQLAEMAALADGVERSVHNILKTAGDAEGFDAQHEADAAVGELRRILTAGRVQILSAMAALEQLQARGREFVAAGVAPPEMMQQFDEAIMQANRFCELSRACNAPPDAAQETD